MKQLNNLLKTVAILALTCGIFLTAWRAFRTKASTQQAREAFVIVSNTYEVEGGKTMPVTTTTTTTVNPKANSFKIVANDLGNKVRITVGNSVAFYNVINGGLEYVDSSDYINDFNGKSSSEQFFLTHPLFSRKESVAGIDTFVLRDENEGSWAEDYYSPLAGYFALKRARFDKEANIITVTEAVSVQFRKLQPNEYEMPNLPIRFGQAETLIAGLRRGASANGLNQADFMAAKISKVKEKLSLK